jgi:hypothetical protein
MIWILLLAAAVTARVIVATLRAGSETPISRTLLFDFGMRRAPSGQTLSRRDRAWNGVASLTGGIIAVAAGAGAGTWADHFPNLSTTNHVLLGIAFILLALGCVVALYGVIELLRAPFAPPHRDP